MEIEEGKYYRDRMGSVYGPMTHNPESLLPWGVPGSWRTWDHNGNYIDEKSIDNRDLIEEVMITPVDAKPVETVTHSHILCNQNGDEIELILRNQEIVGLCVADSAGDYCYIEMDHALTRMLAVRLHTLLNVTKLTQEKE